MSSRSRFRRVAPAVPLAALAACGGVSLPTAPSEITRGVSIYEHANFLGESALLTASEQDLAGYKGPCEHSDTDQWGTTSYTYDWNDCVSSVRVAPGWRAILYRDTRYRGQSLELTADAPNLQLVAGTCSHEGLNDCVTSIKVIAPGAAF
jgi:hypothetical protein